MTTRWEVEKAVLYSQLEPSARLLMLALLAKADNDSAAIPPEHTPSLTTIQEMTGLARSAVAEWLTALEQAGWIIRTKPPKRSKADRTQYALNRGEATAVRPKRKRSSPPSGPPAVRKADHSKPDLSESSSPPSGLLNDASSPPSGTAVVRPADPSSPPSGPASTKSSPTGNSSTKEPPLVDLVGDPGTAETTQTILASFIDYCATQQVKIPSRLKGHYAREIKTALDDKIQPLVVRKALYSMFVDQVIDHPSYLPNRIVAVQTGPERRNTARASPTNSRSTGQNRHVDDLTPEQREARNPFTTATRSSQVRSTS